MKAAVMTTGPGVIIATAIASRNWRSVSQWWLRTTPPYRNGTIASPLPKTNAPAFRKKRVSVPRTPTETTPWTPVNHHPPSGARACLDALVKKDEGFFTTIDTTPHSTNSQTISEPVQTVVIATAANSTHRNRSAPMVLRESRYAL